MPRVVVKYLKISVCCDIVKEIARYFLYYTDYSSECLSINVEEKLFSIVLFIYFLYNVFCIH